MQDVLLTKQDFNELKSWLRTQEITFRDISDAIIVPSWNEAIINCETADNFQSPGKIAYTALIESYPNLKLRWRGVELELLKLRPPKLFTKYYYGQMFGLDLHQAYHQLYSYMCLHSDWPTKRQKYPLLPVAETLGNRTKATRNAVIGIAISTRNKWCRGSTVWYVKKQNRFLSPTLWGQIQMILNEIAHKMIEFGAVHVNTDGYVFLNRREQFAGQRWLEDNQLDYSHFEGEGEILGISTVFIPGIKEPGELNSSKPTRHLEPLESGWVGWWNRQKKEF